MNILKNCAFCALLLWGLSLQASAQALNPGNAAEHAKPFLFSDLPDSLLLDATKLNALLDQPLHASTAIELGPGLLLQGKIVSAAHNDAEQTASTVLKASNRLGAVLTLTRIRENSDTVVFTGRLLSRAHADAYEIVESQGRYYLVKRSYTDLVEE